MSDTKQAKQKMSFTEWIDNYWYHYKWPTIVGVFFLFFFLVCIVQCSTRVDPDVMLMYSGPKQLSFDQVSQLEESVHSLMKTDYNGDGVKYSEYLENIVLFDEYTVTDEQGNQQVVINQSEQVQNYVTQVVSGEAQIYLVSPDVYQELRQQNVLTHLGEVFGEVPVESHDLTSYELGTLDLHTLPGFSELPGDTLLCLRVQKTLAVKDEAAARAEHEWALEIYRTMIEYQA